MKTKAYLNDWIEQNPKIDIYKNSLLEVVDKIEKESQVPIYKVDLTEYYHVICKHTKDAMFEVPHRLFKYLNDFQRYLYETYHALDVNVSINASKERANFVATYAECVSEYVVYDKDKRLQYEMENKTNYKINTDMIAVTQQEIDQCVIYLAFHGISSDDIFNMKTSDVEFTQDQMKIKIPNKKRYLFEENKYIIRIFQKIVFTRYYAQVLDNTNRTIYTKIDNNWLVNTLYRIKHPERYEVFLHYYAIQELSPQYLSKLKIYGKAARAYNKNILNCSQRFIEMDDDDVYRLTSYILDTSVLDVKTNASRFYYGYALYLSVYNSNKGKW